MPDLNLGVHLSLGVDPRTSLTEAHRAGATCVQIFASSPGAWKPPLLLETRVESFLGARRETGVGPAFIHAIYLINLASSDPALVRRSRTSLTATMRAAASLDVTGVVTHLGSHGGRGFEEVAAQVASGLLEVVETTPGTVNLIMENSAGTGGIIGSDLGELESILTLAGGHPRIKIGLDTAHLCAAGWDFKEPGEAQRLVERVESSVGLDRLAVVHCNDSRVPPGSRRDRHACIGEGHIGDEGFLRLLAQPTLTSVPWILETPDLDTSLPAAERFRSLRALHSLNESYDVL